ncbi:chitin synthase III catalytic subunit [Pilobolus umbonatus]|nr:chitin synthase III catalytic subunit [Pilobolus umbonatus]
MTDIIYQFNALSFDGICRTVPLSLCPLIGYAEGIAPVCYSRNIELGGTIIFQPSTLILDIVAIIMTMIMIYHIRSKYTAVGRQEIVMFFYLYLLSTILDMLLVTGIIPISSSVYPWFTAIHIGTICATFWCLMLNGFVGFQFAEDGTNVSIWSIGISSFVWFLITAFLAIGTFKGVAGLSHEKQGALWVFYIIFNYVLFFIYIVSQIILVINTLDDLWSLGDILFVATFFTVGQVLIYVFSVVICSHTKHYVDGLFFGAIAHLITVMMIYKYWDSITKEDLEFAVGAKQNVWDVKEFMGEDDQSQTYNNYPSSTGIVNTSYEEEEHPPLPPHQSSY